MVSGRPLWAGPLYHVVRRLIESGNRRAGSRDLLISRAGHQSRTYLARFQTISSVSPDDVLGLVNFSSSAVSEVIIRF
jgi:hypothetical protein